jgi:hypothetical protein
MRDRAIVVGALLAVSAFLSGCTSSSGVTAEDLTSSAGSATISSVVSSTSSSPSLTTTAPSTSEAPTHPSSSESAGTDGLTAQESADRAAIESQWNKFWQVYAALPRTPESDRQTLAAQVAVDPALSSLLNDANTLNGKGWDTYGQFTSRISWPQSVDGKATAVIADCQDASQAGSFETSTGNKTTVGVARNPLQGTLARGEDGVWRVQQAFYLKDEPC